MSDRDEDDRYLAIGSDGYIARQMQHAVDAAIGRGWTVRNPDRIGSGFWGEMPADRVPRLGEMLDQWAARESVEWYVDDDRNIRTRKREAGK